MKYYISLGKSSRETERGVIHLEILKYGGTKLVKMLTKKKLYREVLNGKEKQITDGIRLQNLHIQKRRQKVMYLPIQDTCVMNPIKNH